MSIIICKIGEIKATEKGEVIVKFTSTSGAEFAGIMGLMKDLVAVSIEPITQQPELEFDGDEDDQEPAAPTAAPPETAPLELESGEIVDADYEDIDDAAAELGLLDDKSTGVEPELI